MKRRNLLYKYFLEKRIKYLESIVYEGKQDEDQLRAYLGDELFNAYMNNVRKRIPHESDLNKQFPKFTIEYILEKPENMKQFIKKYDNARKHNLINGIGDRLFSKYPKFVNQYNIAASLNDYNDMRNYIFSTFDKYRSFEKIKKINLNDIRDFVDSYGSVRNTQQQAIIDGSKQIYIDKDWKVYRVTKYPAAVKLGAGTKWCITGNYDGNEERGEEYFYDYIEDEDLDGGYYFYLNNDGKRKFCLLREKNGTINSIWDAEDDRYDDDNILLIEPEFPSVNNVFIPDDSDLESPLFVDNSKIIRKAIELGQDVNQQCKNHRREYAGFTPLDWAMSEGRFDAAAELLKAGAKQTYNTNWKNVFMYGNVDDLENLLDSGLSIDLNEALEFALLNEAGIGFIEALLNRGADPNYKMSDGNTPLMAEINNGKFAHSNILNALLKSGAKVTQQMIDLAHKYRCHENIVGLLESYL